MHFDGHIAALAPHFTLVKPAGAGPFPVIVLLHGCGGRKPFMDRWAQVAREAGAAALIVDSHTPRGITQRQAYASVCTGLRLRGRERAGDLFAALAWARTQDCIDPQRLLCAGWSHGAWTIMDALSLRDGAEAQRATRIIDLPAAPLAGLSGAFLCYPYAGVGSFAGKRPWTQAPQTTAIIAGRDVIAGVKTPGAALERLRRHGAPIDVHLFDEATHAFDESDAADLRVRYDEALTLRAHGLMRDLIARFV